MAKLLNGKELSLFIKEQQAKDVRSIKQSLGVHPSLAIIRTNPNPITDLYVKLKVSYGEDIGVSVNVIDINEDELGKEIENCNNQSEIHGIIVQLPLKDKAKTAEILGLIHPDKDVDGLGDNPIYESATPKAINWLLAGYNIDLIGKNIVIVGKGKLVGEPLSEMWSNSGYMVTSVTSETQNKHEIIKSADILISATGKAGIITSDLVKPGAVIVDAGVATDANGLVGDVSADVRSRDDITITPEKGGVGPLTVAALFHNVLLAARKSKV